MPNSSGYIVCVYVYVWRSQCDSKIVNTKMEKGKARHKLDVIHMGEEHMCLDKMLTILRSE